MSSVTLFPMSKVDRIQRALGFVALIGLLATVGFGLVWTPPDQFMGNLVRLIYIHPPLAWVGFIAYGMNFLTSLAYLWPRTRDLRWDQLAGASAEVGVLFTGLVLVTGSIWGRPAWGTWWTWDPLLTTTALLFVLYLGYLALRRVPDDPKLRARRSAIAALIAFIDVPVVYFAVLWWKSLHQAPTVLNPLTHKTYIHGSMAWTLLLGFVAFTATYAWMLMIRYRLGADEQQARVADVVLALHERQEEGR